MKSQTILSLAAAITLSAATPLPQAQSQAARTPNTIQGCLSAAKAPISTSSEASQPYNQRVKFTPAVVVAATDPSHVVAAVNCGVKYGYKVTGRGGGHSYSSAGLGGENGHVVVQLNQMYAVTLQSDNTAVVQAGARLGHVATELLNQGGRAISHGSCPGVGASGHSLHGGFGFSSHMYGLALDWMIEATVVLASGKTVKCSTNENADLFWALRGAGSSFGIVTEFKYNTFEAPDVVSTFNIPITFADGAKASQKSTQLLNALVGLQNFAKGDIPQEMNLRFVATPDNIRFDGLYYGDQGDTRDALEAFLDPLGISVDAGTIEQTDWLGQLQHYGGQTIDLTGPQSATDTFYASSLITKEVSKDGLKAFTDYLFNKAMSVNRGWFVLIDVHGGKNSKTAQIDAASTSYPHRDKLLLWQFYDSTNGAAYPTNAKQGTGFLGDWMMAVTNKMTQAGSWGRYVNYADSLLSNTDAPKQYYMGSLDRLKKIKAQFDPKNVFTYPQGVQV